MESPIDREPSNCMNFRPMDDGFCAGIYAKTFDTVYDINGTETKIARWYIGEKCLHCAKLSSKVRRDIL